MAKTLRELLSENKKLKSEITDIKAALKARHFNMKQMLINYRADPKTISDVPVDEELPEATRKLAAYSNFTQKALGIRLKDYTQKAR